MIIPKISLHCILKSEIDKAEIGPASKFSYLKELLIPRMGLLIEGLSFTSEGYSKAKSILLDKFGKWNYCCAYLTYYLTVCYSNSHPNKMYDFYEKLVIRVQVMTL